MLNPNSRANSAKTPSPKNNRMDKVGSHESLLVLWAYQAIDLPRVRTQVRFRGNSLHLLFEAEQCPDASLIVPPILRSLAKTHLETLLPPDQPPIYQLFLYARPTHSKRTAWAECIHLNQLDRYLEQLQLNPGKDKAAERSSSATEGEASAAVNTDPDLPPRERPGGTTTAVMDIPPTVPNFTDAASPQPISATAALTSAIVLSNRSLAKQGNTDAIARYLSDTLSALGVAVQVTVEIRSRKTGAKLSLSESTPPALLPLEAKQRLCIYCQAPYSPDPIVLAEPIAQKLRDLELTGFQDAIIFSQVIGETKADWKLRVDLTPPTEMLKEWARWGDLQSLSRLLQTVVEPQGIKVAASLKQVTLHLVCTASGFGEAVIPNQDKTVSAIANLLETIAPQGIHAATIYGQATGKEAPAWVQWLDLPAQQHPALGESVRNLARQGDEPALLFLLHRLLNPNLEQRLATGGIRVQLLRRDDLLHIMTDAPVCPPQRQVAPAIAKFLRKLVIPKLAGVRIYGRRAGEKQPLWSHGTDFVVRQRLVPEATPEFAASEAYVGELLAQTADSSLLSPTLPLTEPDVAQPPAQLDLPNLVHRWLVRSQLFLPSDHVPGQAGYGGAKVAMVWGSLGLLLALQFDWVGGHFLRQQAEAKAQPVAIAAPQNAISNAAPVPLEPRPLNLPNLSLKKSNTTDRVFNSSGFTQPGDTSMTVDVPGNDTPLTTATTPTMQQLLATNRPVGGASERMQRRKPLPYATFNTRQLDEQLALYYERLAESGPPDVLIVGSSRALRGVDPIALQKALAIQGHPNLKIFNFGINGATAQVVDLLIRDLLTPEQLPKMILWADGARAFNSGRLDITYNGVLASQGYRQLHAERQAQQAQTAQSAATAVDSQRAVPAEAQSPEQPWRSPIAVSYEAMNQWVSEKIANLSALYPQRNQLKQNLRDRVAVQLPQQKSNTKNSGLDNGESLDAMQFGIDFDGFLPVPLRFNPATYYQKYARVTGEFDGDYEAFQLEGKQATALESLVQFTKARQIDLVFVNLPMTQEYLDPKRTEYENAFRKYMMQQAIAQGFVFRDMASLWPEANDYFSDPSHLNRYGAYEVSNHIAQDLLISWPRSPQATPKPEEGI